MDKYIIIDMENKDVIITNSEITFHDELDGCSVRCDKYNDFMLECTQALLDEFNAWSEKGKLIR